MLEKRGGAFSKLFTTYLKEFLFDRSSVGISAGNRLFDQQSDFVPVDWPTSLGLCPGSDTC